MRRTRLRVLYFLFNKKNPETRVGFRRFAHAIPIIQQDQEVVLVMLAIFEFLIRNMQDPFEMRVV